ncbi:MAG TPA: porin [Vicinamibacterales bacterium]|nr:porin [Vicinamibacterales bacterium]
MIALFLALALAVGTPQDQAPAPKTKKGKAKAENAEQSEKKPKKEKKAKKPKDEKPAPDDVTDVASGGEADGQDVGGTGTFVWRNHPQLQFGAVRLAAEFKFQEDGHASYDNADVIAGVKPWELHRNRVGVKGKIGKKIDFEIERELTEKELTEKDILLGLTPRSQWKDVDVNFSYYKNAQITAGKFKVPYSLDEETGVSHNDFVYRSLGANYLAPGRDIGVMSHGSFFKHGLRYQVGAFQHDGDNAQSKKIQGGDATVAGRIVVRPLRKVSSLFDAFEVGTSTAISKLSDDSFRPNGLRIRTVLTQDTFFAPVYVKGRRSRYEGDFDWTIRRAAIRGEYFHVTDTRWGQSYTDGDLPDARYRAWYLTGTFTLTGENKQRPLRPQNDLFDGGIGAIEVAARIERIWADSVAGTDDAFANPRAENILPSGDRAITLGVNWTLNRFIKLQFNAIREHLEDVDRSPVAGMQNFWSRVARLQIVL